MRVHCRALVAVVAAATSSGCVTGSYQTTIAGRPVLVTSVDDATQAKVQGELIAVDADRVWVLERGAVREVPRSSIREAAVRRRSITSRQALTWAAIGGAIMSVGLTVACSSVEGNGSCGGVGAFVAAHWAVTGALAAATAESSSQQKFPPPKLDELRAYARFPQGMPAGLDPRSLRPVPSPSP